MQKDKVKLIFNPHAGKKRFFGQKRKSLLPEVLKLFDKYQIAADPFPTKGPRDATQLAKNAKKEGYETVVVMGGDGTTNEVANGLVDSGISLGIIPVGTFMNIARMLSIPIDLEKAVELLKIRRLVKIDLGELTRLDDQKLKTSYYFIETSGIGAEAHLQWEFKKWEKGDFSSFFSFFRDRFFSTPHRVEILTPEKNYQFQANLVTVANGPLSGASLELAPGAKLNDHFLTVVVYAHQKSKLLKYFLRMLFLKRAHKRELVTIKAKELTIKSYPEMLVHADASLFGNTPVSFKIKPASLTVITGFPEETEKLKSVKFKTK